MKKYIVLIIYILFLSAYLFPESVAFRSEHSLLNQGSLLELVQKVGGKKISLKMILKKCAYYLRLLERKKLHGFNETKTKSFSIASQLEKTLSRLTKLPLSETISRTTIIHLSTVWLKLHNDSFIPSAELIKISKYFSCLIIRSSRLSDTNCDEIDFFQLLCSCKIGKVYEGTIPEVRGIYKDLLVNLIGQNKNLLKYVLEELLTFGELEKSWRFFLCNIVMEVNDHPAVFEYLIEREGIVFDLRSKVNIPVKKNKEKFYQLQRMPYIKSLLFNDNNLRQLLSLLSLARKVYEHGIVVSLERPLLEFAYDPKRNPKHNITYPIVQTANRKLWITPVTGSFRRHILFCTNEKGEIIYAVELKIPGQRACKQKIKLNAIDIYKDMKKTYQDDIDIATPLFEVSLPSKGFTFYGREFFDLSIPVNVIGFVYEDGIRLRYGGTATNFTVSGWDLIGMQDHISELVFENLLKFHSRGYVGTAKSVDPFDASDLHTENYRVIVEKKPDEKATIRVQQVGDYGVFRKIDIKSNEFKKVSKRERKRMVGELSYRSLLLQVNPISKNGFAEVVRKIHNIVFSV